MGDPILRLAARSTPRTRATAWSIVFACAVLVASVSLVDGLERGVGSVADRLAVAPYVYVASSDLLASRVEPDVLVGAEFDYTALRVHIGHFEANGVSRVVVVASLAFHSGGDPVGTTAYPVGSQEVSVDAGLRAAIEAASGSPLEATGNLSLFGTDLTGLPLVDPPPARPPWLPDGWAWVRPELLVAMGFQEGGFIQAVITDAPLDAGRAASLGLARLDAVGAVGFVRASVGEASRALAALAAVLAVVIGLLVYTAMSLEVHRRATEIRRLRALGAAPRTVAAIYEGHALLLAAFGATVGSALGVVLAHAVVSFAPLAGLPNLVILEPPVGGIGLAVAVAVGSAGIAGLVPSRRAARAVRRAPEVVRS